MRSTSPYAAGGHIPDDAAAVLGAVLLIAGGMLFAERLIPHFSAFAGPLVLVGLGAALVLGARR